MLYLCRIFFSITFIVKCVTHNYLFTQLIHMILYTITNCRSDQTYTCHGVRQSPRYADRSTAIRAVLGHILRAVWLQPPTMESPDNGFPEVLIAHDVDNEVYTRVKVCHHGHKEMERHWHRILGKSLNNFECVI